MRTVTFALLLLAFAAATQACGPKAGPTPLMEQARASATNAQGQAAVWARLRVDFKDAKPGMSHSQLWEKALEEVTFELQCDGERDKILPAMVPITLETSRTGDTSWPDRFAVDMLFFPKGVAGKSYRIYATNYYQSPDVDPVYLALHGGGGQAPPVTIPRIERVTLQRGVSDGKDRIEVVIAGDAPANLSLWHHLAGRVKRMKRRGTRVYYRVHRPKPEDDHRVVLRYGEEWVSYPHTISSAGTDDEDEEE